MSTTISIGISKQVEATSFSTLTQTLATTSDLVEKRRAVGKDGKAMTVRLTQSGASAKTEIYAVELDLRGFPAEVGPAQA